MENSTTRNLEKHANARFSKKRIDSCSIMILAVMIASLVIFVACCGGEPHIPYISVSPSSLTFEADETSEKLVTIKTDASAWQIQSVNVHWILAYRKSSDDNLFVMVEDYTDIHTSRKGTITVSAKGQGYTATAEIFVEQIEKPQNRLSVIPDSLFFGEN